MIIPIFSPNALYIAVVSLDSLLDNSYGLLVSNHPISYSIIAVTYATLVLAHILSDIIEKLET